LSDVSVALASLNARLAHVRVNMSVPDVGLVHLTLAGISDDSLLFAALAALADAPSPLRDDPDRWLEAQERDYLAALHYLSHISHFFVLCHDGPALDLSAMRALRSVHLLRRSRAADHAQFLAHHAPVFAANLATTPKLLLPGMITPLLLAVFAVGDDDLGAADADTGAALALLRTALSNQVRSTARALGLLHPTAPLVVLNEATCALLVHCDAALVPIGGESAVDPLSIDALLHHSDAPPPRAFASDKLSHAHLSQLLAAHVAPPARNRTKLATAHSVDMYLPMSRHWFVAAATLQSLYLGDAVDAAIDAVPAMRSPERTLSHLICTNAARVALELYRNEPWPALYGADVHEARLKSAVVEFDRLAYGSCVKSFAERLRSDCLALWTDGRRRCEARSLSDRQCALPFGHAAAHRSNAVLLVACSCGSTQRERADLFDVDEASAFADAAACDLCAPTSPSQVRVRSSAWRAVVLGAYAGGDSLVHVKQPGFDAERSALDNDLYTPIAPLPRHLDELLGDAPATTAGGPPARIAELARLVAQVQEQTRMLLPAAAPVVAAGAGTTSERAASVAVDSAAHQRLDAVARKLSAAIEASCVHGAVGFEYECEQGHRFFEPLDCSSALRACVSASSARERALALACVRCKHAAQLQRIYVATSASGAQCVLHARFQRDAESGAADESLDSGPEVALPSGKLIVVRLPARAATKVGDTTVRLMPNAVRLATVAVAAAATADDAKE
jgi:hypothetical protein